MAGAGYKLFNTGDVLTAAQVNTYLMEQTVMVFADATARTTALSGVVAEGMLSYLKSTKQVEVYNGSAWVASDDPNAIQNTIVDAKGDLIAASANDTPARLAVGNNGDTLVADSSTTTGLRWSPDFASGRNKIINGDFRINQRNFSSTTSSAVFTFDRWNTADNTTVTYSAQTFTLGSAPVAGYEGTNFARIATTTDNTAGEYALYQQKIEDVRTLAGQTVTISFWAKASTGTPKVGVELWQTFGTGGSPSISTGAAGQSVTISTSWTRYSVTISNPSISGKTLGTNNDSYLECNFWITGGSSFNTRSGSVGNQSATIDLWGVQVEAGSVATPFTTATGTLAGELAACQRYYFVAVSGTNQSFAVGYQADAFGAFAGIHFPVTMRTTPTLTASSGTNFYAFDRAGATDTFNSFTIQRPSTNFSSIFNNSEISGTAGQAGQMYTNNASASIAFGAEL